MDLEIFDIAIVGGGPAGLSAAVAAGRMNRCTACFEAGTPRTAHAPRYFNVLGFPEGLSGEALLRLGREQARRWATEVRDARVTSVERLGAGARAGRLPRARGSPDPEPAARPDALDARFLLRTSEGAVAARGLILATGIRDRQPPCGNLYGERGIHYCVVCDGYETRGEKVAVVGNGEEAFSMVEALRDFTSDLHLLLDGLAEEFSPDQRRLLESWGVKVHPARIRQYSCSEQGVSFRAGDGAEVTYPHVFVALGVAPNTALAAQVGCELDEAGFVVTDERQATTVPYVYAAGDCDGGRKQVTQAMAEGEMAALELARLLRESGAPALGADSGPPATDALDPGRLVAAQAGGLRPQASEFGATSRLPSRS